MVFSKLNLTHLLSPFQIRDENQKRIANLLYGLCSIFIVALISYILSHALFLPDLFFNLPYLGVLIVAWVTVILLVRIGRLQLGLKLFLCASWLGIAFIAFKNSGVHSAAMFYLLTLVVFAQLLLGLKVGLLVGGSTILFSLGLLYLEISDSQLQNFKPASPVALWISLVISIIVITCLVYFANYELNLALKQSRQQLQERKQAESALQHSEKRYRSLILASSQAVWTVCPNGTISDLTISDSQITPYTKDILPGESFYNLLHPTDRATAKKFWDEVNLEKRSFEVEHSLQLKVGLEIDCLTRCIPILNEAGQIVEWVGVTSNITAQKQAKQALVESEERFRLLSEAAFEGIGISVGGTILEVNSRLAEMMGCSREEMLNHKVIDFVAPESVPLVQRRRDSTSYFYEHLALRKDGTTFPVEVQTRSMQYAGKTARITAVRDISERKKLQEQLLQAQKLEAVGRLVGGITHDFNNLLTIILSSCDLLRYTLPDNAESIHEEIENIQAASQRAASLTRQLLTFSRKQVMQPQELDLNSVVGDLAKMVSRVIGEDIKLETSLQTQIGKIYADLSQMEQVVMNLVVNARDAMPDGGQLKIETRNVYVDKQYAAHHFQMQPGWYVMLSVSDTGTGIPKEIQNRLFEPFFTTKEKGKGTGLGLATVHGIVKQSNGHIWVYSEVRHGTTFKLYFPAIAEPISTDDHPEIVTSGLAKGDEVILLVEDDLAVRKITQNSLEALGYTVLTASVHEALKIALRADCKIDLLMTDVVMPEINGPRLAQLLLELRPDLKVLYISGYSDSILEYQGILDPSLILLEKPFTINNLAAKVRQALVGSSKD